MLHCQGCHGPDGSGAPGAVPDFHNQVGKFLLVPGGREYLIRVPGVSQSELNDARVALQQRQQLLFRLGQLTF